MYKTCACVQVLSDFTPGVKQDRERGVNSKASHAVQCLPAIYAGRARARLEFSDYLGRTSDQRVTETIAAERVAGLNTTYQPPAVVAMLLHAILSPASKHDSTTAPPQPAFR